MSSNSLRNDFEVHIRPLQRIERIFFSAFILTSSLLGYFIVPGPLGDLKFVSGTFLDLLSRFEGFKKIFVFCPKIEFFQGISPRCWVKNDQIFKSAFFTRLYS